MFVRSHLELEVAFPDAEAALLEDAAAWVPGLLRAAEDRGQHLLAEVGFAVDTRRLDQEVEIEVGTPYRDQAKTVVPVSWRASRLERLFPQLEGDLELARLGPRRTQLSLSARYRPPLGSVGRVLDRALLHRVAEATIEDFVERAAARLLLHRVAG